MEHSLVPQKRGWEIPSPRSLAALLEVSHRKNRRIEAVPRSENDANLDANTPKHLAAGSKIAELPPPPFTQPPQTPLAPVLHSVPPNLVPILPPNTKHSDFFTDVTTDLSDERLTAQLNGITSMFPPPLPPFMPLFAQSSDDSDEDEDSDDYSSEEEEDQPETESPTTKRGGIMVPFIFPPPPVINPDELPYSVASFKKRFDEYKKQEEARNPPPPAPVKRGRKPSKPPRVTTPTQLETNENTSNQVYLEVPPLPFPPPNYMPYPLVSDRGALTPFDVFSSFIEAHDNLPRSDMVVASAAGSLHDFRTQARQEHFNIEEHDKDQEQERKFERQRRQAEREGLLDNEKRILFERSELEYNNAYEDDYEDYLEYINNIDRSVRYDYFDRNKDEPPTSYESNRRPESYARIEARISDVKNTNSPEPKKLSRSTEYSNDDTIKKEEYFMPITTTVIITNPRTEVSAANSSNKERRRAVLLKSYHELEALEEGNRREIYQTRKLQLLQRLDDLKQSKISFTDSDIQDDELLRYKETLDIERDEELIRLKLVENYELLKNSLVFYQDSNKVYKRLLVVLINKLEKLKNFFEYQRNLFVELLESNDLDIFDVKTKEAVKIFQGISNRDYNHEVKDIVKKSFLAQLNEMEIQALNSFKVSLPDLTQLPKDQNSDDPKLAYVHDFMPLVTPLEFSTITGDIPTKTKASGGASSGKDGANNKNSVSIKHQIFKNSLYDKLTSGSDTNSEASSGIGSAGTTKRGRGRRPGTANGATGSPGVVIEKLKGDGPDVKYSEASLLAKIMKQFSGPQAAKPDELNADLDMIGVKTRWPVQK